MAYKGIDRKRFEYLLRFGTSDSELRRFFMDCRLQLINLGGKVQNLPHGFKARTRKLAVELPPSTDRVIQIWFSKHITMVDPAGVEEVVREFKKYEEIDEQLSVDATRRLARSCLIHLFCVNPPQSLLELLNSPIDRQIMGQEDSADNFNDSPDVAHSLAYPNNLPLVILDLIQGKDADEHLEGFPPELATFIAGLQSARQGKINDAKEVFNDLPAISTLRNYLEQYVRQQETRLAFNDMSSRGLRIIEPEIFDGTFDYEIDEVLGYCVKDDKPTTVFVHPLAVIAGRKFQLLTDEKRKLLFPENGDVIAFAGNGYPRQPRRGEIGIWRVMEHPTAKGSHFHLVSEKRTMYEVRSVPFPSTDHDSIREFLKDCAENTQGGGLRPLLFQLDDRLIVGGRSDWADLSKDEAYELGLRSWNALPAIRLDGQIFVPGPLPKEQSIYECASLRATVRKLFKDGKITGGLTQAQLKDLAQSLGSQESQFNALRIQRIKSQIGRLADQQEAFDALVHELMDNPSIKQRIDLLIEEEVSKQLEHKSKLQADIDRLQKERGEWEERNRKQREAHKKLPDLVSKAVRARFEKAREDGLGTFADIAIFQALSTPAPAPGTISEGHGVRRGFFVEPIVRDLSTNGSDAISVLKSYGVPIKQATSLVMLSEVAFRAGLMVCVRGIAARPAVEGWAKALKQPGVLIDSTIGLIEDSTIRDVLNRIPPPQVLTVLDSNLSALDLYAKSLSDLVFTRAIEQTIGQVPAIFLTLTDSVGALPLPRTFECISVTIDLDVSYTFKNNTDIDGLMSGLFNPDDGTLYKRLWLPACNRLQKQLNELESENLALVLSVL